MAEEKKKKNQPLPNNSRNHSCRFYKDMQIHAFGKKTIRISEKCTSGSIKQSRIDLYFLEFEISPSL